MNRRQVYALLLEKRSDPHCSGHRVELHTNLLAAQVFGGFDGVGVDDDEAVPEEARWENRNGFEVLFSSCILTDALIL